MATYINTVQMWKATTGGLYPSKEEAEADEQTAASGGMSSSDQDLRAADQRGESFNGSNNVLGNDTGESHISPERATQSNALFSQGFTDLNQDGYIDEKDQALSNAPLGTQDSPTATRYGVQTPSIGTFNTTRHERNVPIERINVTTPGGGAGGTAGNATAAAQNTEDAKNAAQNTIEENEAQNENLFAGVYDRLDKLGGGDYGMSDQARAAQQEGLQMQRDLLKRAIGFDPNHYATQFADQGLARSVALARSGGSAAQQQAQTFAALEGAPALYAEGARQAEGIQTSRLNTAEQAAKEFGSLGTMTRSQDEQRQQFESNLQVEIGKTFSDAVQGKMALNEQESSRMTEVWMNFAQLQSVYDKMSFEEQEAALDRMMQEKGLDQQYKMFKEQLKEEGKIHAKDIIGGFFGLAGGVIGAGGTVLAAGAGKH